MKISAVRYHDFSAGHRVVGHEGKCRHFHGHNYRTTFYCQGEIDGLGRVIDFSVIKSTLCQWLEDNWDHKMILWRLDARSGPMMKIEPTLVLVDFNPTAENLARYLLEEVGPSLLTGTGVTIEKVVMEETRKCSAIAEIGNGSQGSN